VEGTKKRRGKVQTKRGGAIDEVGKNKQKESREKKPRKMVGKLKEEGEKKKGGEQKEGRCGFCPR